MASSPDLRRTALAITAAATTAALVWFGTGLNPAWPWLWFAPLPVLLYVNRARWWSSALVAFAGWFTGYLNVWGYLHGVLGMPAGFVVGSMAVFTLVFSAAVLLYRGLLQRAHVWRALIGFPAAWVSFEYLLNLAWQNGTAFNLAYTQLGFLPFLQLASITGPWGMSFLLLTLPAAIAVAVHTWRRGARAAILKVGISFAVIAAVLIYGTIRLALPPGDQTVAVGLIASDAAGNKSMALPGAPAVRLFRAYAGHVSALAARGAKVVVLPEKIAVITPATRATMNALFQSLSNRAKVVVVVGVYDAATQHRQYNEARIYAPGKPPRTYAKHHLLLPFEAEITPGTRLVALATSTGRWGVEICKDMDFTQLSRQYGKRGVGLMLVPGLDFAVDRTFHGHMAIMRGVESGFSVAHSARRGYLTVSDDRGRILGQARSDSAPFATLLVSVPVTHNATIYQALGDWFAWVALALLVLALASFLGRATPDVHTPSQLE